MRLLGSMFFSVLDTSLSEEMLLRKARFGHVPISDFAIHLSGGRVGRLSSWTLNNMRNFMQVRGIPRLAVILVAVTFLSLFFACESVHCVSFTCIERVGNVCEAKVATHMRLFGRSSPEPTSHLHKCHCFFPLLSDQRSQCLSVVQGTESLKHYCLSTREKAWDFSDEDIVSSHRSPVAGSE